MRIVLILTLLFCNHLFPMQHKLIQAALADDDKEIEQLIEIGANSNEPNQSGILPLVIAYNNEKMRAFKKLLDLGADPNCFDNGTPLLVKSVVDDRWLFFREMMDENRFKLNLNLMDELGQTALMKACIYGGKLDYLKRLLAKNADSTLKDTSGNTALCHTKKSVWLTHEERLKISGELLKVQKDKKDLPSRISRSLLRNSL